MPHHGDNLRRARESAGLDVAAMAALLERGAEDIARAERDPVAPSDLLQDYAEIFGLGVRALLRGEAEDGPASLLFRSMMAAGSELDVLAGSQLQRVLGRFMQKIREAAELRAGLGATPPTQSDWPRARALPATVGTASVVQQAESLSLEVRRWLDLGNEEPVASAIRLARERFGVDLVFVDVDTLAPQIEGASTLHPTPAILLNLIGGPACWWRTRMTIMHELCHLLFDREILGRVRGGEFLFFSPEWSARKTRRWRLVERFDDVEQRANAFAACMLVPSAGVRAVVGLDDRPRPSHVEQICERYRVGRTVALNRLQDVFQLSDSQRHELTWASGLSRPQLANHPDAVAVEDVGLCSPWFKALAVEALARDVIDEVDYRRILGLGLGGEHPGLVSLRPRHRAAADAAVLFVQRRSPEMGAVFAGEVRDVQGGVVVPILQRTVAGTQEVGVLRLSPGLVVENSEDWRHVDAESESSAC
jgi:hypothetical protein